jgi:hypothetical protein
MFGAGHFDHFKLNNIETETLYNYTKLFSDDHLREFVQTKLNNDQLKDKILTVMTPGKYVAFKRKCSLICGEFLYREKI